MQHLNGVTEPGDVVGGQWPVAYRSDLGGDPVLQLGMAAQRPQRVRQGGRRRVISGAQEHHQFVANILIGQRLSRLRVSDVDQRANKRCVASRVGPAALENVVGESMKGGTGGACAPPGGGRQPPRGPNRPYGAIGDVHPGGAKRLS